MSNEVLNIIETCIVIPILIAISSYVIAFLHKQTEKIKEQIKNEKTKRLIDIANNVVDQAVISVTQTYVDELKVDGVFGKEEQDKAFNKSKNIVYDLLTSEIVETIQENYGDLEKWINTKIEESVVKNK